MAEKTPKTKNNAKTRQKFRLNRRNKKPPVGIEDLARYRRSLKRRKIFSMIFMGCAVVILIIILATAFFAGKFSEFFYQTKQLTAADRYPVTYKEQAFTGAAGLEDYLAVLTRNGVLFLDEKGGRADEAVLGYSDPVLRSSRDGVMVYDLGGTQFEYLEPFQPGFQVKTDEKIIAGALSESGLCAAATFHNRYAAEVTVYHPNGSEAYRWYSASDKVTSLAFSPGSGKLYVCCINAEGGFLQTIIYALNIHAEEEIYRTVLNASAAPIYLCPMTEGRLAVVTTSSIAFLDKTGTVTNTAYYYSDLYAVGGNERYLAAAMQNIHNNNTNLVLFDAEGSQIATEEIMNKPKKIELNGESLFCLTDRELLTWDFRKQNISGTPLPENCSGMTIFSDRVFLHNNNTIGYTKKPKNSVQ